jgi:hypothetical protein
VSSDDRLKKSAARVNAELDKMAVPAPPSPGGSRVLAFALGAVATLAVIAGGIYLIGRIDRPDPVAAGSTTTTDAPTQTTLQPATTVPTASLTYQGNATVLDDGDGPVVCAGGVMDSYPPQCSGPALDGLDWDDVPWAETANGVTWAEMAIEVGIDDGGYLTLVGGPSQPGEPAGGDDIDFTPPCPAPDGGWTWTDGAKTSQAHFDSAMEYIQAQPDLSATWVYNLIEDPYEADQSGRFEVVLVARFTGNISEHEAAIEELWGGPLCVAEGVTDSSDLLAIQDELTDRAYSGEIPGLIGFGYTYTDEVTGTVVLGALIATPEAYDWFALNYVDSPVSLESQLQATTVQSPTIWAEPADYSFVLNQACGEQSLIGTFEVHVVDHDVDSATGLDAQARAMLENGGLGDVPTIADLLAGVERAGFTGAEVAEVTYDEAGVPEVITIDFSSDVIDDESCYTISEFEAD